MTTIEDKIKLFSKIVYDKVHDEKQKDFDDFEKEKERIINDEKQKIENENKIILKETEKKAALKSNELIAKEKMKNQQCILKLRQQFIDDSMADLKKKVIKYTDDPAYKDFLLDSLENTLSKLDKGSYDLYATEKDICNYKDEIDEKIEGSPSIKCFIKQSEYDIIGGVLAVSRNGRIRIDNTLASKIEDAQEYIGIKLLQKTEQEVKEHE